MDVTRMSFREMNSKGRERWAAERTAETCIIHTVVILNRFVSLPWALVVWYFQDRYRRLKRRELLEMGILVMLVYAVLCQMKVRALGTFLRPALQCVMDNPLVKETNAHTGAIYLDHVRK